MPPLPVPKDGFASVEKSRGLAFTDTVGETLGLGQLLDQDLQGSLAAVAVARGITHRIQVGSQKLQLAWRGTKLDGVAVVTPPPKLDTALVHRRPGGLVLALRACAGHEDWELVENANEPAHLLLKLSELV